MTADWRRPGNVTLDEQERGIWRVCVTGNFHRDLEATARDTLVAEVRKATGRSRLLIDLRNVVRIDSWGEEELDDLVEDVVAAGGRVAVLADEHRPHLLRGLLELLRGYGESVLHGIDETAARAWLVAGQA